MIKCNEQLPNFILYCVLFFGSMYEIVFSGNFSSYSTSGKVKSIILTVLIGILIIMYLYRDKSKDDEFADEWFLIKHGKL